MVRVIAANYIKSKHIETVKPLLREILEATNKEKGCIEYRLYENDDEPGFYVFVEEWESVDHLRAHFETEHFKRIVPQLSKYKSKDGTIWVMKEFK